MKYIILLLFFFKLVPGQVNIETSTKLVLNGMGPGRTSRAWYFHSPGLEVIKLSSCSTQLSTKFILLLCTPIIYIFNPMAFVLLFCHV